MIILAGTKEEHLNMLEGGIIAKLLDEKWNTFAKVRLFFNNKNFDLVCNILIFMLQNKVKLQMMFFLISDVLFQKISQGLGAIDLYICRNLCTA